MADELSWLECVGQLRIEYYGAIYHVMNRGDWREPIFYEDTDLKRFVAIWTVNLAARKVTFKSGHSEVDATCFHID